MIRYNSSDKNIKLGKINNILFNINLFNKPKRSCSLPHIYGHQKSYLYDLLKGSTYNKIDIDTLSSDKVFYKTSNQIISMDNYEVDYPEFNLKCKLNFSYYYKDKNNNIFKCKGTNNYLNDEFIHNLNNYIDKYVFVESYNCTVLVGF